MVNEIQGNYDTNEGVDKEAKSDAATIRSSLERDGAEKAVERMKAEVDAVPADRRIAYDTALLKNLQGGGNTSNVLPEMSIAFAMSNRADVTEGSNISKAKLLDAAGKETNPLYQGLYREFGARYDEMKASNYAASNWKYTTPVGMYLAEKAGAADTSVTAAQVDAQLSSSSANREKRASLGLLATKPELFSAISGSDGNLSREDAETFRNKILLGTDGESEALRKKFGATPADLERLKSTAGALVKAFDDPGNQDNKKGSVLVENSNSNFLNWHKLGMGQGDYMTESSLASGLGYRDIYQARERLPYDAASVTKPRPDVPSVTDYDSTKLAKGKGPWTVANQMLQGQQNFFENPSKAQSDLTSAMHSSGVWHDRANSNQVTPENRNTVRDAIKATGNQELSDWFESRYPALPEGQARSNGDVVALSDFSNTKLRNSKDGPRAIAGRMMQGQEVFFANSKKAASDLATAIGVKAGIHNSRRGAEQVTNENIDKIIEQIKKTGNRELEAWFIKRYPKR